MHSCTHTNLRHSIQKHMYNVFIKYIIVMYSISINPVPVYYYYASYYYYGTNNVFLLLPHLLSFCYQRNGIQCVYLKQCKPTQVVITGFLKSKNSTTYMKFYFSNGARCMHACHLDTSFSA